MAKVNSIKCDECGEELIIDDMSPHNYGLSLKAEDYGTNSSSMQHLVCIYPPIEREHNFCGLGCLQKWINEINTK